ncbi:MAG TPA: hypothetical protein VHG32_14645 [Thermoanaerobaculia bacterium]|jgi:hypothetical protein|nr:hypothetical protein [Thermoanaerobaculia bacterium]
MATATMESTQGARLRAAVDRLHAAQLAALAVGAAPAAAQEVPAARAAPEEGRNAYGAERQLLEHLGEMGSLLVRLGWLAPADAEAAAVRRRVVTLAVAGANTLAELVSLAFDVESVAAEGREGSEAGEAGDPGEAGAGQGAEVVAVEPAGETGMDAVSAAAPAGAVRARGGSNGASSPGRAPTSMRAVTDTNRLLIEQLKRLMQNVSRRESWRSARPAELWRGLLKQVAGLFPLVVELEGGALSEADAKELARLAADAANYIAFLRFYPRLPTA